MESYHRSSSGDCNQPLDFTSKSINITSPILDLSCKKQEEQQHNNRTDTCNLSPVSLEMRSVSPSRETTASTIYHLPYQSHQISCADERQSPLEGRTFMVTPPSESDSPKKHKFYAMHSKLNISESESSPGYLPLLPIGNQQPLPIPSMLCNILTDDNSSQFHVPTSLATYIPTSSNPNNVPVSVQSPEAQKKTPRPFKAYPKDPLSMSMVPPELVHDFTSKEAYSEFRRHMIESVKNASKGTNIKMRRVSKSPSLPTSTMEDKDSAYWERRRKNNEAAKRSRDARRAKEDEIAIRAAFLERENMQLKCEILSLRNETAKLRCMIYSN